jgi:hypothetical protein
MAGIRLCKIECRNLDDDDDDDDEDDDVEARARIIIKPPATSR